MKSKVKKLKGTAREIDITLSSETVKKTMESVFNEFRKNAEIPGFRKGKAPEDLIRKKYDKDAMDEVKRKLLPQAYQEALKEHSLLPVSYPELWDIRMDDTGALSFKASVDIQPDIKLQKYKGMEVSSEKISVGDEEVEEAVERVRNMFAEFEDVDRQIERGDFGICDIEAYVDGKSISNKRENAWVEADKEASLLGMGEELCGMKKGEKKEVDVVLPEDYTDKAYAGKDAVFHLEVKEVKIKKLPDIDDELAKKMQKEDLAQMKNEIKDQLFERKNANNRTNMKNQIMEKLLKKHSFSLPESMVRRQLDVLVNQAAEDMKKKGVSQEKIDEGRPDLEKKLLPEAENKIRMYFILAEISDKEEIRVSNEDIDNWIKNLAEYYKQTFDQVKKYYEENNLIGGVAEQLREDKTLDFLVDEANITTK